MLDDVLARLGERHREAHRRGRVEVQRVDENLLRLLLHVVDDFVHVFGAANRRDLEQHATTREPAARHRALELVQLAGVLEECRARPVRRRRLVLGYGERRPLESRLREREQRGETIGRRPARVPRVEQQRSSRWNRDSGSSTCSNVWSSSEGGTVMTFVTLGELSAQVVGESGGPAMIDVPRGRSHRGVDRVA